jgi:hypothetical protein
LRVFVRDAPSSRVCKNLLRPEEYAIVPRTLTSITLAFLIAVALAAGIDGAAATVTISTAAGPLDGSTVVTFDQLALGSHDGTSDGVGVTFTSGDGQVVTGSASAYAAPFVSSSNGLPFGITTTGADGTRYLSTGIGSLTLTLPGPSTYLGLLWGSVDTYNTLALYNGQTLVGTIAGSDVTASPNGSQGAGGSYYVNVISTLAFTTAVAISSGYAFEFDDVAYKTAGTAVPEPEPLALLALPFGFILMMPRRRSA